MAHLAEQERGSRPAARLRGRRAAWTAVALAVVVGVAALMLRRVWAAPASSWAGGPGDPPLFIWYLRWIPYALGHGHNPLLTGHLGYPRRANLMWNTSIAVPAVLMTPVTLTVGPILAYNLLLVLGYALSGWCAYLAIRRYVDHQPAALVGALLYEAGPFLFGQGFGHLHLVLAFTPPLLLLLLDDLLVRQPRPAWQTGVLLGALLAAQLLIAEELLASEALVAAVGAGLLAALHPRRARANAAHAAAGLGVAAAVALALGAGPLAVQFLGPGRIHGVIQPPDRYVSDLLSFVVPFGLQRWHPGRLLAISDRFTGAGVETDSYLGVPLLLLLAGVAVRGWARPLVRVASLLLVAVALLSLGPHLHLGGRVLTDVPLPWRAVILVPPLANVLPSRLAVYLDLLAGLLLAVFVDRAAAQPSPLRRLAGFALAAVALAPLVPNAPLQGTPAAVPAFFTGAGVRSLPRDADVLVAPFVRGPVASAPMVWQAEAGMWYRMPEGYVLLPGPGGSPTFGPAGTATSSAMEAIQGGAAPPAITPAARARFLDDLAAWQVQAVVVGPMPHEASMVRFFSGLFERPPSATGGVDLWLGPPVWRVPGALPAGGRPTRAHLGRPAACLGYALVGPRRAGAACAASARSMNTPAEPR